MFTINGEGVPGETWKRVCVVLNSADETDAEVILPSGEWSIAQDEHGAADPQPIVSGKLRVRHKSGVVPVSTLRITPECLPRRVRPISFRMTAGGTKDYDVPVTSMIHSRLLLAGSILALGVSVVLSAEETPKKADAVSFNVAPAPAWVKPVTPPNESAIERESPSLFFVLVDRQQRIEPRAFYYHDMRKVISEKGVQDGASLSVSFNPAFEKLTLHCMRVIRNGVSSDRLNRSQIKLIPSEDDPQRLVYHPYYTAQTTLDDVRVGDLIEFAYTIEGANPLLQGKCGELFPMQWSVPVGRSFLRIIYSSQRKLKFQARNDATQPVVVEDKGITERSYEARNVPGLKVEDDTPNDYLPKRQLQVSEFDNWAALAQWAVPLFESEPPRSHEFNDELGVLQAIQDPEQRVVAALRFVEDEIRYIAFDSGPGAQRPTSLDEVMRRRFADYKDKVVLFVALLRRTGIDAAPALVSNSCWSSVRERLPSPRIFDHAIAQVHLGESTYWLDPTRTGQRGPLSQIYVANYGHALVLRPDSKELTAFHAPPASLAYRKVESHYRIPAPGKNGELDVITDYRGLAADLTRTSFRESTREEIQQGYLDYYTRIFPEIKAQKEPWYEELPAQNGCRVTESYVIPNIWQLSEDKEHYKIFLKPGDIYSALGNSASAQRNQPLAYDYPKQVVEGINVQMFENWPLDGKAETMANEFFRLRDEPITRGSYLQFNYTLERLKDRVEVSELPKFNEAIDKAKDSLGYSLTYRTPEQLKKNGRDSLNWAVAAAALCFLLATSYLACHYFRNNRLAQPLPPPIDARAELNGIGGWLILPAIGQVLRPLGSIKAGFDLWPTMLNTNSWRSLTDPIEASYHPLWAPTLLFELFFNIASLVFGVLLIALFFKKRAAWPRCFVIFLIGSLLGNLVDVYFVHHIPRATESLSTSVRDIVATAVGAAIWIPYLYRSRRVKSTFRY